MSRLIEPQAGAWGRLVGVALGHATDLVGLTGCSVLVFPQGAVAGHHAIGQASGSRELAVLTPRHRVERIQAICLAGGSAFGLAAASGVARRLEQAGIGHVTAQARVPIVAAAVVYDLNLGDPGVRPDETMGYNATAAALAAEPAGSGCVGAGTGVCAGKVLGVGCATKTGLGLASLELASGLQLAALAVVNPVGDVLDPRSPGRILAGTRGSPTSRQLVGTVELLRRGLEFGPQPPQTVLGVVVTNARLDRVQASWLAEQASVVLARVIDPPFTLHDGDVVFACSVGDQAVEPQLLALLTRDCLGMALVDGCRSATSLGGLPTGTDLDQPHR